MTDANLAVHHGRFDDSVPYSHTVNLALALEKLGAKKFFFEIFDGGHGADYDAALRWFGKLVKPLPKTAAQLAR